MSYRKTLMVLLIVLSFGLSFTAMAGQAETEAAQRFRFYYPQFQVNLVKSTPIAGMYEVVDQNNSIFYFFPATGHVLTGELWTHKQQNLTKQRFNQIMSDKFSQIPLDKGLKIGDGPNIVVEVTDPDCPYCRDGAAWFAGRTDVTRYIFFTPLTNIHPDADKKARYVLSAENPAEAYQDVMDGLYDDQPLPEFKDNGLLQEHVALGQRLGTRGTPNYWVNGQFVSGSNHKNLLKHFKKADKK